jgi:hypothetical protein
MAQRALKRPGGCLIAAGGEVSPSEPAGAFYTKSAAQGRHCARERQNHTPTQRDWAGPVVFERENPRVSACLWCVQGGTRKAKVPTVFRGLSANRAEAKVWGRKSFGAFGRASWHRHAACLCRTALLHHKHFGMADSEEAGPGPHIGLCSAQQPEQAAGEEALHRLLESPCPVCMLC